MIRIISWNIGHLDAPWRMLAQSGADIALLQEAKAPPADVQHPIEVDDSPWYTTGGVRPWRTAIVKLSHRVTVRPLKTCPIDELQADALPVSRRGTLCAAEVTVNETEETLIVASIYGSWEGALARTGSNWIYADASVHRLISDISALVGSQNKHRILVAGDINILYGHGESGSKYWKSRYDSVFRRMQAIGLPMVGPQAPEGGIQAQPWPNELPLESRNVPTFRTRKSDPASASRQLDFVFASESIKKRLHVRALNRDEEWGPSDHCRVQIEWKQGE